MPSRSRCRIPVLTLSALLCGFAAQAQERPTFSVSITEPDEVIEQVGTTRHIDRAYMEAHDARTLDEALRLLPGVYVRTGGDGTPRIDIRGFRSRQILLLIDGVPYNSTDDGQFDPARISTESIRGITVSYGASSILYGDNAMAAVIEIVTGTQPASAGLDLTAGTPKQGDAAGRVARTYGHLDFMLAADAFSTNGYRLPSSFAPTSAEDGGTRDNSDRDRRSLRGNVTYTFSPSLKVASEWTVGNGSYGIPPSTIDNASDIFAQPVKYQRVNDYRTVTGQGSFEYVASPRFNLRGWAYRNHQREEQAQYDSPTYSSIDNPLVPGTFESTDFTNVTGSTVLGRVDLGRIGWLRLAVNQRRESFDTSGVIRDVALGGTGGGGTGGGGGRGRQATPVPVAYALRPFASDDHVDIYSAGTEWEFHPARRLGAVLGGAANWQNRVDAPTDAEPTWIAGASYDATAATRLHASVTRKIRFASISQLYDAAAGNAALQPERAYSVDAGVDQQWGRASQVGVSLFSTTASNFIEKDQGARFVNRDKYRFSGAELTLDTHAVPRLDLRVGYTFLDSIDLGAGGGAELQYRPRHRASVDAAWAFAQGFTARGTVYGVADQVYFSRGTSPVEARAGDYTVADASITRVFTRRYDVMFAVNNLFDTLYEQAYGLPREGRTAFLTLRAHFD